MSMRLSSLAQPATCAPHSIKNKTLSGNSLRVVNFRSQSLPHLVCGSGSDYIAQLLQPLRDSALSVHTFCGVLVLSTISAGALAEAPVLQLLIGTGNLFVYPCEFFLETESLLFLNEPCERHALRLGTMATAAFCGFCITWPHL